MLRILMLALALVLSTGWVATARQYPQTGSRESGTAASGQKTVEGCLHESNANYTLTSVSGVMYQLQGDTATLSKHVGHEVRITGSASGVGTSSSTIGSKGGTSSVEPEET
jgi:Protein of unknown function (DUF5818)